MFHPDPIRFILRQLQGALHSLYSNYEKYYELRKNNVDAHAKGTTPPVFIVVCNSTVRVASGS